MYSPQFSDSASITIRRFAWALGIPMTAAVDRIIKLLPTMYDPGSVCLRCKDQTKCNLCGFKNIPDQTEKTALLRI